ncbi:transposase [Paraburkholderia sp. GAS448]|uniref:transposase n=1 Tax=Paraburkholderia sp. GAS448 TaxID=3035136 RepID=UPI003D258B25
MCFDELSDDEWAHVAALVADEPGSLNRRGRPRLPTRTVVNAVLWIMTTGEPWSRLPARYPCGPTCRHRFAEWLGAGTLAQMINVLSGSGRTFTCIPQAPAASVARSGRMHDADGLLHGIVWTSPETWRSPAVDANAGPPADAISAMTRQLSGPVDQDDLNLSAPGQPDPHGALWTNHAWSSAQIEAYRGHTIHASAQPVPQMMYRACVQIVKDGRRIERSGLIGPRFADTEAAQQYALDWARQWIERECATLALRSEAMAVRNVSTLVPRPADEAIRRIAEEHAEPAADRRGDGAPAPLHDARTSLSGGLKRTG